MLTPVAVDPKGVQGLQALIDDMQAEGFDVTLHRVMLPAIGAPEPEELDQLIGIMREAAQSGAAVCFSCSTGVERSELGLVLAGIMNAIAAGVKPKGYIDKIEGAANPDLDDKAQYKAIVELCQYFGSEGPVIKGIVDEVIDQSSELVQFRKGIQTMAQAKPEATAAERSEVCSIFAGRVSVRLAGSVCSHGSAGGILGVVDCWCLFEGSGCGEIPAAILELAAG